VTCTICEHDIPAERIRRRSKFCSVECQNAYRKLYMKFRKLKNEEWKQCLAEYRKTLSGAGNIVPEAV